MESVRIRPLVPDDAESLGELFEELRDDPASVHFHPHRFTRDDARRVAERSGIREDLYFGAFQDGRLVGYGMLRGWDEGYTVPSFGVAVGVNDRGTGIGRKLLRYAIRAAAERGAKTLMLKVHPDNVHAKRLYESEGFTFDSARAEGGQVKGTRSL